MDPAFLLISENDTATKALAPSQISSDAIPS